MSITQTMTNSCKTELLSGTHNFAAGGDTFKIALYDASASLGASTTAYSATNEISGTGYSAGGATLSVNAVTSGTTPTGQFAAYATWTNNPSWTGASFSGVVGALIYNSSKANRSVAVLNFNGTYGTGAGGVFEIQLPTAAAATAIVRCA